MLSIKGTIFYTLPAFYLKIWDIHKKIYLQFKGQEILSSFASTLSDFSLELLQEQFCVSLININKLLFWLAKMTRKSHFLGPLTAIVITDLRQATETVKNTTCCCCKTHCLQRVQMLSFQQISIPLPGATLAFSAGLNCSCYYFPFL